MDAGILEKVILCLVFVVFFFFFLSKSGTGVLDGLAISALC